MERRIRALVVEDEFTSADIRENLIHPGYDMPGPARNLVKAIRSADVTSPDLILMDILLDGKMTAIEAAGQIHESSDVHVISLTAHSDEKTMSEAKATRPFGYLIKPFDERKLRILKNLDLKPFQGG